VSDLILATYLAMALLSKMLPAGVSRTGTVPYRQGACYNCCDTDNAQLHENNLMAIVDHQNKAIVLQ
jgi:hypothetical protein